MNFSQLQKERIENELISGWMLIYDQAIDLCVGK